jgi:multisubunit Na+/H+ antiporter MnhB subunit
MLISSVIFGAMFGIVLVVVGIRRLLEARRGHDVFGCILWGSVGVALGFALIAGMIWVLALPPAPN